MALFIVESNGLSEHQFHFGPPLGDTQPKARLAKFARLEIMFLQADGNELEMIRHQFTNIRMHNGRIVIWTGEDAKFIAQHLRF